MIDLERGNGAVTASALDGGAASKRATSEQDAAGNSMRVTKNMPPVLLQCGGRRLRLL